MSTFKARGIVLKEVIVNDKDKILTLLLKDYGKLSVWARNSRLSNSRLMAGTSLFSYSDFIIYDSGKTLSLNQVDIIENFYKITEDLNPLAYGTYFMELTDKATENSNPINNILLLLLKSLLALSKSNLIPPKLVAKIFEIKFLQLSGYMPITNNCSYCQRETKKELEIYFGNNGVVCNNCKAKEAFLIKVSPSLIYTLNYILSSDLNNLYKFSVSIEVLNLLSEVSAKLLNQHVYLKLKSQEFIKHIENI